MSTLPTIYLASQSEITEIMQSGAKALKLAGMELQPIKREMLKLPDDQASAIVQTCDLLFAAVLSYENAQFTIAAARDAITIVQGRLAAGTAKGVVEALFHGPTAVLLWMALDRAPIAYYALSEASPDLDIIKRTYDANSAKNRIR